MGSNNSSKAFNEGQKDLKTYTDYLSKERENMWRTISSKNSSERGSTSGGPSFSQESEPANCIRIPCYCAKKDRTSTVSSRSYEVKKKIIFYKKKNKGKI